MGGGPNDVRELRLLNRIIRWTPQGLLYEADPRHAEQLIRDLEQFGEKSVRSTLSSPGLRRDAESVEAATPLGAEAVEIYRDLSARANYLSLDRPDLAFAAKECCRKMAEPSSLDWTALVRLARYLAGRPPPGVFLPLAGPRGGAPGVCGYGLRWVRAYPQIDIRRSVRPRIALDQTLVQYPEDHCPEFRRS